VYIHFAVRGESNSDRRVAITGMGAVTPMGRGFDALLDRWLAGEVAGSGGVAPCADFDPAETMTAKEIRRSDRLTQFAVDASTQAVAEAGWDEGLPAPSERIGCVIGTAFGGLDSVQRELERFKERGPNSMSPLAMPRCMHNATVCAMAMRLGLHGATHSVVSACASGTDAVGTGLRWIREGYADAVVAGGTDGSATDFIVSSFRLVGTLTRSGLARPFDAKRDGFVMGEGAGMFTLELMELAEERGAPILGEVLGYAGSSDGLHPTSPDPNGQYAAQCIRAALDDAGVEPGEITYINAHGTGTEMNDRSETLAIKAALGDAARKVRISSTKSVVGHSMGAAGAVEAGVTVHALRRGVIPPTLSLDEPDEGLDLDYVPLGTEGPIPESRSNGRLVALSNSFGFGGHNTVLCLSADAA
jgi:3-oxoacyl-[acyl-carrier-protein] synthase II